MSLEKLKLIKHPCFLLIQEMFAFRGVSLIDAYLHGISETTLKSYKSIATLVSIVLIVFKRISLLNSFLIHDKIPPMSVLILCRILKINSVGII
jgi:hypothetical protein